MTKRTTKTLLFFLVSKLRLGNALAGATPVALWKGVDCGRKQRQTLRYCFQPAEHCRPCEAELLSQARAQAGAWERGVLKNYRKVLRHFVIGHSFVIRILSFVISLSCA